MMQDESLLSLDLADRSVAASITAAMHRRIAEDPGLAALQACIETDGSLRQRYSKVP